MQKAEKSPCRGGPRQRSRRPPCQRSGRRLIKMRRKTWKAITKKPLRPSIESIRNQFGIAAWCLAWTTERGCRTALTAPNRFRPEPDIFLEHYARFSKLLWVLVRSAFGKVFEIASKNRVPGGPVEWTQQQLTFMLDDKLRLFGQGCRARDWIVYACDGYYLTDWPAFEDEAVAKERIPIHRLLSDARGLVRDSWLAPLWLRSHPYKQETAWNRETAERSRRILDDQCYLLVGIIQRELKRLADQMHFKRTVVPIDPGDVKETAVGVEMREKPLKPLVKQRNIALLEECEDALSPRQYRAMELKMEYALNKTDIARHMGTSRQNVGKLLAKAERTMNEFLANRKARLRAPREGQK